MRNPNHTCYFDGKYLLSKDIFLNMYNLGILRGYGIFDYFITQNRKPFLLGRYLDRFFHSAEKMNLTLSHSKDEIAKIIETLLKKNEKQPAQEFGIRLVLTGGDSFDVLSYTQPSFAILIEDKVNYPKEKYENGVKIIEEAYMRDMPEVKSLYYSNVVKKHSIFQKKQIEEILYHDKNLVLECSRSNIFIVKNNVLYTPEKNILKGITRGFVLEIAKENYEIKQQNIPLDLLYQAEEVFLTSSNKKVLPVIEVGGKPIADGKVGKNTKDLIELFQKEAKNI